MHLALDSEHVAPTFGESHESLAPGLAQHRPRCQNSGTAQSRNVPGKQLNITSDKKVLMADIQADGTALRGSTDLYVVRNADNEIAQLQLTEDWSPARVVQRIVDPGSSFRRPLRSTEGNSRWSTRNWIRPGSHRPCCCLMC